MKNTIQLVGILGAAAASMAVAGGGGGYYAAPSGKASVGGGASAGGAGGAGGEGAACCGGAHGGGFLADQGITGEVSIGWDSDYYFRGANLGGSPIWTGAEIAVPVASGVELGLGAWYINPTDGGYDDELDLYATLGFEVGGIGVTLGYTAYTYPEAGGDTGEVGIALSYSVGAIELGAGYYHDHDLDTDYYELTAGTSVDITDGVAISLGATLGLTDEDTNHALLVASLPIALSGNATLEPYIAGNFQLDTFENGEDEIFGGVALTVSF